MQLWHQPNEALYVARRSPPLFRFRVSIYRWIHFTEVVLGISIFLDPPRSISTINHIFAFRYFLGQAVHDVQQNNVQLQDATKIQFPLNFTLFLLHLQAISLPFF